MARPTNHRRSNQPPKAQRTTRAALTAILALTLLTATVTPIPFSEFLKFPFNPEKGPIPVPSKFGFIGIDNQDLSVAKDKIWYWFFPSRANPKTDPLVIWLTGGPGCASDLAIGQENGPFIVNRETGEAEERTWSWNRNSNMLYVDQPLGTGFSECGSGNFSLDEHDVTHVFYKFFTRWLENPNFQQFKGRDLYVTGESYGGHYVPYISNMFFRSNNPDIRLKGLAIGNGLSDPDNQYTQYVPYATLPENLPYTKLSEQDIKDLTDWSGLCGMLTTRRNPMNTFNYKLVCAYIISIIEISPDPSKYSQKFNTYNIKLPCPKEFQLCYDMVYLTDFFNRKDVQQFLGVNKTWVQCDNVSGNKIRKADWWNYAAPQLIPLLENGVKVLIYSGDLDFICNWKGGDLWTNKLPWSGQKEFNRQKYVKKATGYGESKKWKNFEFLRFYDAGHMVPYDKPKESVMMLNEFLGQPIPK